MQTGSARERKGDREKWSNVQGSHLEADALAMGAAAGAGGAGAE